MASTSDKIVENALLQSGLSGRAASGGVECEIEGRNMDDSEDGDDSEQLPPPPPPQAGMEDTPERVTVTNQNSAPELVGNKPMNTRKKTKQRKKLYLSPKYLRLHRTAEERMRDARLSSDLALFLSNPSLREALSDGSLDLTSYSTTVAAELQDLERNCIDLYRGQRDRIVRLRDDLSECDAVLSSLQELLLGFQADLGGLGSDIKALQLQSQTLGVQLSNRRNAEWELRQFINRIIIPPNMAAVIGTGDVDETFVMCIRELEDKFIYVTTGQLPEGEIAPLAEAGGQPLEEQMRETKGKETAENMDESQGDGSDVHEESKEEDAVNQPEHPYSCGVAPFDTEAGKEMTSHLYKLRLCAGLRIRQYFLSKIAELRRPRTNVRMIQVNVLLKYAYLNEFLQRAAPELYAEVRDVYVESMSGTLCALFRTYSAQLLRLDSRMAERGDVIAIDEANLRDAFSNRVNMTKRGDAFALTNRGSVLDGLAPNDEDALDLETAKPTATPGGGGALNTLRTASTPARAPDAPLSYWRPILAHVALAEGERYPYEVIFRSVMTHLMDAATNEFVFARRFFGEYGADVYEGVLARTLGLVLEQLENYLFNCHDAIALLLMIKLTHAHRRVMRARRVKSLEGFFDRVASLLWPRLKVVIDSQLRSVRSANSKKLAFGGNAASAASGTALGAMGNLAVSGGPGSDQLLHAHYVSRRFAEFMASMLLILSKGGGGSSGIAGGPTGGAPVAANAAGRTGRRSSGPASSGTTTARLPSPQTPQRQSSTASNSSSTTTPAAFNSAASLPGASHRGSAGDMLLHDLEVLTDETIQLLQRLADENSTNKRKVVFLINNVDQILCLFQERKVPPHCREMVRFGDLLMKQRELFVEEELLHGFSKMIAFVQQTEAHMARLAYGSGPGGGGNVGGPQSILEIVNPGVVEGLVQEFASTWRSHIEQINRNVLSYFSNFRNGMEILKQVLTQLLLYYTRFQDIIRKVWRSKPPAFCKDLLSTSVILAEIKKYALAI